MSTAATPVRPLLTTPASRRLATLPVYEVAKENLEKGLKIAERSHGTVSAPLSSLGTPERIIQISAWQLFHAAPKTELARSFTVAEAARRAVCFSMLFGDLSDWGAGELRLADGAVGSRKDSARTDAAGRFGESCTLRLMQELTYIFWDHLPTLWRRARSPIEHAERVRLPRLLASDPSLWPSEQPDFIVESATRDVALVESKGHFITPARVSSSRGAARAPSTFIKESLAEARGQIERWQPLILPSPSAYAVGTFLRERLDTRDPSLMAYADPPGKDEQPAEAVGLPDDFIRRGNYGAWLVGMGFESTGNALRNRTDTVLQDIPLLVTTIEESEFALGLNPFLCPCLIAPMADPRTALAGLGHLLVDPLGLEDLVRWFGRTRGRVPVIGLEVNVLRLAGAAAASAADRVLLQVKPLEIPPRIAVDEPREAPFVGSIFPDGTLYGEIEARALYNVRVERFRL